MTSEPLAGRRLFVWTWLPGADEPVVAGALDARGDDHVRFTYGRSYLQRPDAISLLDTELPLRPGPIEPLPGLDLPGVIRDAGPDAWGRRVVEARTSGSRQPLGELDFLWLSGSDRTGALDFQLSATEYVPRGHPTELEELVDAAGRLAEGKTLSPDLSEALQGGTSIGGARPKVTLTGEDGRASIAKLSVSTDPYPVVKAEALGMELARRVGIDVAPSRLIRVLGRDVLLVERFDRVAGTTQRRAMVSALTLFGVRDTQSVFTASYPQLVEIVRHRFTEPAATCRELFRRVVLNVCIGNTDDHARNHAAFWDGRMLTLTPAYDLCPQLRTGTAANQSMHLTRHGERASQLAVCRRAAHDFAISRDEAERVIDEVVTTVRDEFHDAADTAGLTAAERDQLWGSQILNDYVFWPEP